MTVPLSLLDRLLAEDGEEDLPPGPAEIHGSIRTHLDALFNTRRPWRPLPPERETLAATLRGYGLPDFTATLFDLQEQREALLRGIAEAVALFEPRLEAVRLTLQPDGGDGEVLIRLAVSARLTGGDGAPAVFEAVIDSATTDMLVTSRDE
ncbi:MAG: type secretion system baseplate subunit TssE [Pseudomonadota bacterium]|jgi:type VI secretion system lysozyme-like protein